MGCAEKVVLAYSGGVDTSLCIPYLKQEWGVKEAIALAADLGQEDELEPIREKALKPGNRRIPRCQHYRELFRTVRES
jgi:argininosuccinate synthase